MKRSELLQLADRYFSCLTLTDGDENVTNLRLISEMGQDVTDEFETFIQAFLLEHQKSPYQPKSEPSHNIHRYRICIVEDSECLLEEMVDFFLQAGFDVTGCGNGRFALDALQSSDFDLVLSDVQMPVMTGLELLDVLQSRGIKIPFFLMSSSPAYEVLEQYQIAGVAGFFIKPFNLIQMKDQILEYLDDH